MLRSFFVILFVSVKQQVYALQLSLFPEEQKPQVQPKPETVAVPEHKRRTKVNVERCAFRNTPFGATLKKAKKRKPSTP